MVGDAGLPLHRLGLLQVAQLAARAEIRIQLVDGNRLLEFRTRALEQRFLAPICRNCFESSVCMDAALFVEPRAAVSENGEANHAYDRQTTDTAPHR